MCCLILTRYLGYSFHPHQCFIFKPKENEQKRKKLIVLRNLDCKKDDSTKKKIIPRPRKFNLLVIFSIERIFLAARRLTISVRRNIFHGKITSDHFWNRFKLIANIGDPRIISSLEVRQLEILGSQISAIRKYCAYELPELCMCTAAKKIIII